MRSGSYGSTCATIAALGAAVLLCAPARAQSQGFALDRFDPSERGSGWFAADTLDLRGSNRWAVGLVGDWAFKPLVAYATNGDEHSVLVRHQVYAHLGASWVPLDRLRLSLNAPLLLYQKSADTMVEGTRFAADEGVALGDLRLAGDFALLGEYGDAAVFAAGMQLYAPTGRTESFSGDGEVRIAPRVQLAGDIKPFAYSGRIGFVYRGRHQSFARELFGSEVQLAGALGLRALDERLLVGPEIWASTVVSDDGEGLLERTTTPFEAIMGVHYDVTPRWRVGGGVGPGLSRGLGTPAVRVLASLEWIPGPIDEPPPPPPDGDLDGILDGEDACPADRGDPNDDPALHGCPPPPPDRDGDGILDADDACPDERGEPDSENPERHGCPQPPPDRDGDGILDEHDACPDEPGPKNDDREKHGCPPSQDRDNDGILDERDACPEQPGPESDDPKRHGCPKAIVEDSSIRILERIEFDTGKATLRPESDAVLQAVSDILKKHADITKVSVEGHTDNQGTAWLNRNLSRRRAASVVDWLVAHGIEAERLTSKGFGADKPIDTNQTDEGRQNNRRVEFKILGVKNKVEQDP